jgi:hypothetical protein
METSYKQRLAFYALLAANFIMSLANVIYLSFVHGNSAHFDSTIVTDDLLDGFSGGPVFDLETWTCEVNQFQKSNGFAVWTVYGEQCAVEKGARWLSLILFVQSGALLVLFLLDWKRQQSILCYKLVQRSSWQNDWI